MKKIFLLISIFQLNNFFIQAQTQLNATGSGNVFSVTYPANIGAGLNGGIEFTFRSNQNITGPATLNLNGTGARNIVKNFDQPLQTGDIKSGHFVQVIFDVVNNVWQMESSGATVINSSQWTNSGANIYFNTGNVGIGTTAPNAQLHVIGNSTTTGIAMMQNAAISALANGILSVNGTGGIILAPVSSSLNGTGSNGAVSF